MGHKNLLVTHTLYQLKGYSEAHAAASAAPAASFKSASRTNDVEAGRRDQRAPAVRALKCPPHVKHLVGVQAKRGAASTTLAPSPSTSLPDPILRS